MLQTFNAHMSVEDTNQFSAARWDFSSASRFDQELKEFGVLQMHGQAKQEGVYVDQSSTLVRFV